MSNISKTILQYKELPQLQEFCEAQSQTILQISKKLQRLEEERDHLKLLLETSVPLIKTAPEGVKQFAEDDSEFICTMEIGKLKNVSLERELTLEEARRLDTYFKILTQINSRVKNPEKEVEKLSDQALLQLVETPDGK